MINKFMSSRKPTDLKKNSRQMNPEGACEKGEGKNLVKLMKLFVIIRE